MKKLLFVLGCGRSGTSVLTRMLRASGYDQPEKLSSHAEDPRVCKINDALLEANGFKYYDVDREITTIPDDIKERIEEVIDDYSRFSNPVLKCPRMVFCLPAWLPHVDEPNFVGICRKKADVVDSQNRHHPDVSLEQCAEYWFNHNIKLLALSMDIQFPLLHLNDIDFLNTAEHIFRSYLMVEKFDGRAFSEEQVKGNCR